MQVVFLVQQLPLQTHQKPELPYLTLSTLKTWVVVYAAGKYTVPTIVSHILYHTVHFPPWS